MAHDGKTEQESGKDNEECSLFATKALKNEPKTARVPLGNLYAASFVTRECATSLACDPTIFISCQS